MMGMLVEKVLSVPYYQFQLYWQDHPLCKNRNKRIQSLDGLFHIHNFVHYNTNHIRYNFLCRLKTDLPSYNHDKMAKHC